MDNDARRTNPHGVTPLVALRTLIDPSLSAALLEAEQRPFDADKVRRLTDAAVLRSQAQDPRDIWLSSGEPAPGDWAYEQRRRRLIQAKVEQLERVEITFPALRTAVADLYARLRDGRLVASFLPPGATAQRTDIPAERWDDEHIEDWAKGTAHINSESVSGLLIREAEAPAVGGPPGRTEKTKRGFEEADMALMPELHRMVANEGMALANAAMTMASRAAGGGAPENKAERLERRYRKWREGER